MLSEKTVSEYALSAADLKIVPHFSNPFPHTGYVFVKLAVEWVIALVLLILTAPIIGVCAAIVKLTSPGPAFYRQVRLGRNGEPFSIYKIRSMRQDSEVGTGAIWSSGNDPRVTRIGRFLRDTHIDELPQLWNVLTGQMSLIGPRPERPELVTRLERVIPRYRERLALRPGLTGLAQVQLPPDTELIDVRRKLAYDLFYLRELNFGMDLRIMASTFFHLAGLVLTSLGKIFVKAYGDSVENDEETRPLFHEPRHARTA